MNGASPREQIIEVLKKHPEGLTITTISELTKLHRHTVTKYIYELRGADLIYERDIGPAKLCYIKGLTKKRERETMNRLSNHKIKTNVGQIQLVAVVLFLVLVPAAIITAQNATNITGNVSVPIEGYMIVTNEGDSNLSGDMLGELVSEFGNTTNETTNQTEPGNITEIPGFESGNQNVNGTVENNETKNDTTEIPLLGNQTGNETQIEPPATTINGTNQKTEDETQMIESGIISPERVNREELFEIKAYAKNTGSVPATNVKIKWFMPEGFVIASGSDTAYCQEVGPQDYCWNNITVKASLSSSLGASQINTTVNYG